MPKSQAERVGRRLLHLVAANPGLTESQVVDLWCQGRDRTGEDARAVSIGLKWLRRHGWAEKLRRTRDRQPDGNGHDFGANAWWLSPAGELEHERIELKRAESANRTGLGPRGV